MEKERKSQAYEEPFLESEVQKVNINFSSYYSSICVFFQITNNQNMENDIVETRIENKVVNLKEWVQDFQKDHLRSVFSRKYFAIALFLGLIPTLVGLVTVVINGATYLRGNHYRLIQGNCSEHDYDDDDDDDDDDYDTNNLGCFQKDTTYGVFTLFFIFLPGINIYPLFFSNLQSKESDFKNFLTKIIVAFICILTFPFMLVVIKICCLFNHGKNMKILAFQFVFSKGLLDSSLQLCFQAFVMISRSERIPSWIQILVVVFSSLAVTKINTENFLTSCKDLNYMFGKTFKQKLVLLLRFGPMFFLTTLFRCGSFSLIFALLGLHSIWFYCGVALVFITIESFIFTKDVGKFDILKFLKYIFLSTHSNKSVLKALPSHLFTLTTTGNHMFHMTFFLVLNTIILSLLTLLANLGVSLPQASGVNPLINNLLLLNSLVATFIVSGLVSYALYIHQVFNKIASENHQIERLDSGTNTKHKSKGEALGQSDSPNLFYTHTHSHTTTNF